MCDSVKNEGAAVTGGEHSLHVFHDEDGRFVLADDPQILLIEEVFFVALKLFDRLTRAPCASRNGVRLAGRAADQNPVVCAADRCLNAAIQVFGIVLPEFKFLRLFQCFLSGIGNIRMCEEFFAGNGALNMVVVAVRNLPLRKLSIERTQ